MLDKSPNANHDSNYDLLATVLADAKVRHLPKKIKNFTNRNISIRNG